MDDEQLLVAKDLSLTYGATQALVSASITVRPAEAVGVIGPSGSGKSSLLHCLSGILRPSSGSVRFLGKALEDSSDEELSLLRRTEFGFVFQFGDLVPELSLVENVALPLRFSSVKKKKAEGQALEVLDELAIGDLAARRPSQVSGGEMQRAAIARSLVHEPRIVFADEPTGALDSATGEQVLEVILDRTRARGASLVLVTHDRTVAARADRIVEVRDGRTVGLGAVKSAGSSSR
ncbi:MAG TPA: ABC transporter ATP-binding protein [Actinomycetota bacterium]|nr:ABC transporter ATP-binding protein [Actinomycetota bacterium]